MKKSLLFFLLIFLVTSVYAKDIPDSAEVIFSGKEYIDPKFIDEETNLEISSIDFEDPDNSFEFVTDSFLFTCRVCQRTPVTITIASDNLKAYDIKTNTLKSDVATVSWHNISERSEWKEVTTPFGSGNKNVVLKNEGRDSFFYAREYEWQFILKADVDENTPHEYYQAVITVNVSDNT